PERPDEPGDRRGGRRPGRFGGRRVRPGDRGSRTGRSLVGRVRRVRGRQHARDRRRRDRRPGYVELADPELPRVPERRQRRYGGPISKGHEMTGRDAYVVGGANSAGQAALYLARYARRVTLVVRGQSLDDEMSHYLIREVAATRNVDVLTGTSVVGGGGEGRL